ncbi:MAG: tyrosine-type recombinase/integrase [Acidimicrobiales bacterium]
MAHVEKRGPGRWRARYRDPVGIERSKTFDRRIDAERWLTSVEHAKLSGAYVDPTAGRITFGDWAMHWLDGPGKRPSAWARDESIIRVHLLPPLGNRALGTINPGDVQGLVTTWAVRSAARTARRQYDTLRAILNAAVAAELIARSPCRGIRLPAVAQTTRHVVSADELASLADAMGTCGPMAYLGAVLGLRWGECAGLRVGRLDFLRSTLEVAEQFTRGPRGAMVLGPPKSQAARRTMAVPAALMALLADHLVGRGLTGADIDEWVFTAPHGGHLDYSHFRRRVWGSATAAAGLDGLGFHDLRRANATGMVLDGVDLKTAQTRLGHSDRVSLWPSTRRRRALPTPLRRRFSGRGS